MLQQTGCTKFPRVETAERSQMLENFTSVCRVHHKVSHILSDTSLLNFPEHNQLRTTSENTHMDTDETLPCPSHHETFSSRGSDKLTGIEDNMKKALTFASAN